MEIVQGEVVPDDEASEVLQQVQSAVQTMQRPSMVVSNEQVRTQLEPTDHEVAMIPVAADTAPGTIQYYYQ